MRARSRSTQSLRRRGCGSASSAANFASLGRPTSNIGLAPINSAVYRKVHNTFQLDQQR